MEKHRPLALSRVNFSLLFLMVWSGQLIHWANSVYGVRVGGYTLFKFFPQGFMRETRQAL